MHAVHFLLWGQSLLSSIWGELGSCMGFFNLCQHAGTLFQPRITFLVVQVGFAPQVQPAPGQWILATMCHTGTVAPADPQWGMATHNKLIVCIYAYTEL